MNYTDALQRLAAICAGSEQCEYKMREKLKKWEIGEADSDKIIDFLYDEKYLDESRFANAYARDKMRYSRWGRQKIDQGLRLLRIGNSARREALDALPADEYLESLRDALAGKVRSVKADSNFERKGKLIRFALGRGFEMPLIMDVLSGLGLDEDD